MDRDALDWLFSTAPQAIAALVGLIYAGTSFVNNKIDYTIIEDPSLSEIGNTFKKYIYKNLNKLLVFSGISIIIDLLFIFFNPACDNQHLSFEGVFSPYFTLSILAFILNVYTIFIAVDYISEIMIPDYIDNTVKKLSSKYQSGTIPVGTFIENFIKLDRILNDYSSQYMNGNSSNGRPITNNDIMRNLKSMNIIDSEDLRKLLEIRKLRNLILHGGDIAKVEAQTSNDLIRLTEKISKEIANR